MTLRMPVLAAVMLMGSFCLDSPSPLMADVYYGSFSGDHVDFENVRESSLTVEPVYGSPLVFGDTMTFLPGQFGTQAINCGAGFINGHLTFTITAHPGYLLDAIHYSDLGNTFVSGSGATSSLSSILFVNADGNLYTDSQTHAVSGSAFGPSGGFLNGGSVIDFPDTQSVSVILDNHAFASAAALQAAFAQFDQLQFGVTVTAIPEPHWVAIPIVIAGLAGRLVRRRWLQ